MPRMALLRHRRSPGDVPLSQRHAVLAGSVRLRLVVQRQMRPQPCFIRNQQSAVRNTQRRPRKTTQIHHERTSTEHIRMNARVRILCLIVVTYLGSWKNSSSGGKAAVYCLENIGRSTLHRQESINRSHVQPGRRKCLVSASQHKAFVRHGLKRELKREGDSNSVRQLVLFSKHAHAQFMPSSQGWSEARAGAQKS